MPKYITIRVTTDVKEKLERLKYLFSLKENKKYTTSDTLQKILNEVKELE